MSLDRGICSGTSIQTNQCNCHWERCREGDEKMVSTGTEAAPLHFWFSCQDSRQVENPPGNALKDPCVAGLAGATTPQCTDRDTGAPCCPAPCPNAETLHVMLHCWCCGALEICLLMLLCILSWILLEWNMLESKLNLGGEKISSSEMSYAFLTVSPSSWCGLKHKAENLQLCLPCLLSLLTSRNEALRRAHVSSPSSKSLPVQARSAGPSLSF